MQQHSLTVNKSPELFSFKLIHRVNKESWAILLHAHSPCLKTNIKMQKPKESNYTGEKQQQQKQKSLASLSQNLTVRPTGKPSVFWLPGDLLLGHSCKHTRPPSFVFTFIFFRQILSLLFNGISFDWSSLPCWPANRTGHPVHCRNWLMQILVSSAGGI